MSIFTFLASFCEEYSREIKENITIGKTDTESHNCYHTMGFLSL